MLPWQSRTGAKSPPGHHHPAANAPSTSDFPKESPVSYAAFLERKKRAAPTVGRPCTIDEPHPILHDWQRRIVAWAVTKGRAAIWADTGLGKTFMQIEWARLSGERALIVAPLAVCHQTVREAARIGVTARY